MPLPIFVWWIGEAQEDPALMDHVRRHVARAFEREVVAWSAPERPRHAYDARRRQHASGTILKWLVETGPRGGKVLGVTDRDLFIPILTYVFGEAQLGGDAAVVSTARLAEGADAVGRRVLVERLAKEAVHEIGHAFGLLHCGNEGCVMSRSPAVREVDEKSSLPCAECRARLSQEGA
ncbi:MAG TPA: archaemetzincin family Zn-dependent metalloprotease [Anaeromyxobacter sp.]|nr:archaemetzincin family Zn-dependent metalloprotease [Anaeromyxobacter sp.]